MDNEPLPVDHKDEPGDYRQQVREGVEKRVGMRGQPVTGPDELVGSWDVAADTSLGELPPKPMFVYHLHTDGSSVVETTAGDRMHRNTGEWRLNSDGTFSLLTWCPPDPEFGIDKPQLDEERNFVAALADGRLVMWNGDGSLLLVLSRQLSK
jgi:hypothetical protein